jgi:hypothetical protein
LFLLLLVIACEAIAQVNGRIYPSSVSGKQIFSVGDIHIENKSGLLTSVVFISNSSVTVKDLNEKDDFFIYPNPVSSTFQIKVNNDSYIKSVHVIDSKGNKSVLSNFDLTSFSPGHYHIIINEKISFKLIKI